MLRQVVILLCTFFFVLTDANPPHILSTSFNDHGLAEFHGTIREDGTTVKLSEAILVDDDDTGEAGLICGYVIHHAEDKHIPFVVDVTDSLTGAADIRVREGESLDYEHREKYKFAISAFNCGANAQASERAMVHIQVEDVNEYAPVFDTYSHEVELEEGLIHDNFLTLIATDSDRSPEFHTICDYRVKLGNETFTINKKGELSNKVVLDHKAMSNHVVAVTAVDCGQLESEQSVLVAVKVVPKCIRGWSGIPERIEYTPGSGFLKFASNSDLNICDKECEIKRVSVDVSLSTQHIGKGCDRDTYSMHSQRQMCGVNSDSMELLPNPTSPNSWTQQLTTDDGHESDLMFKFDGEDDAVEVPETAFNHHLNKQFTVSTWMRHDGRDFDLNENDDDAEDFVQHFKKEHILCMSDSNKMNRHHYSWYLHGDKMVFLWRQEAEDAENKETFNPAEWRWNLDEINDNQWHHYAISVNFPKAVLYVDGELTQSDLTDVEIIDDWPLHKTNKVKGTSLYVGACWQGGEEKLDMFFEGYLAGLYILNGELESDQVINCLTNCKEFLEFESLSKQHTGMTVSFTRDQSEVSISGTTVAEVIDVVRELTYRNARGVPSPGRRNVYFDTTVTCAPLAGETEPLRPPIVPRFSTYILVLQAQTPVITLSGARNVAYTVDDLADGQYLFQTTVIDVKLSGQATEAVNSVTGTSTLIMDKCVINADPSMNLQVERITFPRQHMTLPGGNVMDTVETNEGAVIIGPASPEQYERVMRGIVYFHEDADRLSSRKFYVTCSSQSERFLSNKILFTVSAIHVQPNPEYHAHAQANSHVEMVAKHIGHQQSLVKDVATPSFGMIAIIVVCVGFLLFMIVLGIFRIRTYQRRTTVVHVDEKQEMEWDDSPLNIIVNPMEQELVEVNEQTVLKSHDPNDIVSDDTEDDDDEYDESCHDDVTSEEEEVQTNEVKELAWDDSTLSF